MGMSITATIAYGVAYDPEEDELEWMEPFRDEDDDFDWDRIVCRHAGLEELDYSDYPERDFGWSPENEATYKEAVEAWRKRVGAEDYFDRRRAILEACPLDLDYAGTAESTVYVIHLRGARAEAYWSPVHLTEELSFGVSDQRVSEARTYADELGIPWSNPDWLLFPYYSH